MPKRRKIIPIQEVKTSHSFKIKCKFKNKKQKKMSDIIKENRITFVEGPAGTGKAQPLYSKILTSDGWTTMGELSIGDYIIGKSGNPIKVCNIFPQGKMPIYEVIMDDGSRTECCDEHLWFTQTVNDRYNRKWNKTIDGKRTRYSSPIKGSVKKLKDIKNSLTYHNRLNHHIPIMEPVNFNEKPLVIDPYIMGLLIGDGSLTRYISLTSGDESICKEFITYIKDSFDNLKTRIVNEKNNCLSMYVSKINNYSQKEENIILNTIRNLKLNVKSEYKFIPNDYLINSTKNRINLLKGLMDSDGHITKKSTYYTTVSKKLKDDFCFLIKSLGGTYKVTKKYPTYTHNNKKKIGKLVYSICFKLLNTNPFKLKRKFDNYNDYQNDRKYYPIRRIKEINYIGEIESQCIMVDSEDHLYITDDFIVTHNSIIALKVALDIIKQEKFNIPNIVITKPIVSVGNDLGHLPGNVTDKTNIFFNSIYANLNKIVDKEVATFLRNDIIEERIINYMRGETLGNIDEFGEPNGVYCIMDEGQNTTPMEMKTYLSRLGEYSKIIVLYDPDQIDIKLHNGDVCGAIDAKERLIDLDGIGYIQFDDDDIVRDPFLIEIMKRYRN